jgi:Domain of unknown function (DUF1992)
MANKLQMLDDEIGRRLAESVASGELSKAAGYGKPLDFDDAYRATPEEFRMGYKILKDAGFVPPEVEMMKKIAALREQISRSDDRLEEAQLRQELSQMEMSLSIVKARLSGCDSIR